MLFTLLPLIITINSLTYIWDYIWHDTWQERSVDAIQHTLKAKATAAHSTWYHWPPLGCPPVPSIHVHVGYLTLSLFILLPISWAPLSFPDEWQMGEQREDQHLTLYVTASNCHVLSSDSVWLSVRVMWWMNWRWWLAGDKF